MERAFTIALPLAAPPVLLEAALAPTASTEASTEGVSLAGIRVLVVEDELDAAEFVKRLLENYGAVVVTATSAREALDIIGTNTAGHPDQRYRPARNRRLSIAGTGSTEGSGRWRGHSGDRLDRVCALGGPHQGTPDGLSGAPRQANRIELNWWRQWRALPNSRRPSGRVHPATSSGRSDCVRASASRRRRARALRNEVPSERCERREE